MYHLDCSVNHLWNTPWGNLLCSGDAVRSSVCLHCVLCILVTATLSVILLPVGYRAVVVWRKLAGVLCKAGARKKGPKSNLHQRCEWTSGKRAPLGCPRQNVPYTVGFNVYMYTVPPEYGEYGSSRQAPLANALARDGIPNVHATHPFWRGSS